MTPGGRVIVLGAGGYIGRHVVRRLRDRGTDVVPVERRSVHPRLRLDLTEPESVVAALRCWHPAKCVVNLAGVAHGRGGSERTKAVNDRGVLDLLAAMESLPSVPRLVHASSAVIYGFPDDQPVAEAAPLDPVGIYAESKAASDRHCLEAVARGSDVVVLRFASVYSREWLNTVRNRSYVPFTCRQALLNLRGTIPSYSLCAIENAVGVIEFAVDGRLGSGPYNVADQHPYPQPELVEVVRGIDGSALTIPLPNRPLRTAIFVASRFLPAPIRDRVKSNANKLLRGLALDLSKLRSTGFDFPGTLDSLRTS